MLECQKIEIKTIPHRHIASDITNFTSAVCAVVTQMSSVGEPIFTSWANTYSADLYSSYTTVLNFSSSWISPNDTFVYNNSANILQVNTVVNNTTGNWNSVYNSYNSSSASFLTNGSADIRYVNISGDIMTGGLSSPSLSTNNLYVAGSTINFFDGTGNVIETLKSSDVGNFKSNYTLTNSRSGKWEEVYSNFSSQSANNNSVYNTVQTNSSTNWNYQGTDLKSLTSNWQNTYNTVSSYSATWVNDAPQTLTFNNINAELTISGGNTVSLSSLSGGGNGSVGVNYLSALSDVSIPSPVNGQVLTYNSITNKWNAGTPLSASGAIGYYGSFYDTTAQTLTSTTQAKRINIAQTYEHNGVSIDNNRIVFNYDGVYELIYSIQYKNTSNDQQDIYIWLKQNGVDIPNSSSVFTIPARKNASVPAHLIAVTPFMSTLTAGDFIELYWHCNNTSVTVETFTTHANPTIPDTPGVIVTVKQVTNVQIVPTVGAYLPLSGGTLTGAVSTTNVLYTTGGNSANWNSVYNSFSSASANWNYQGTDIKALTSNWQNTFTSFSSQSANNASVFTTVRSNSAVWSGGLTIFRETSSTVSPNNTRPVYAIGARPNVTDIDIAFIANGVGATLAQIPDNLISGGNKRGFLATDWQKNRNNSAQVAAGSWATIGGGSNNTASGNHGVVGGGNGNTASATQAKVGGGQNNTASGTQATIGGGASNTASATQATIGGGQNNTASGTQATIAGGANNTTNGSFGTIAGGIYNTANGPFAVIGGGNTNVASGEKSFIGGGNTNVASGQFASVLGGISNSATAFFATVGGGGYNAARSAGSTVGGGTANTISVAGAYDVIAGGTSNAIASIHSSSICGGRRISITGSYDFIGGGVDNTMTSDYSVIGGGFQNNASGSYDFIGGGVDNTMISDHSVIGGGVSNSISTGANKVVIGGGENNTASESYAIIAGGVDNVASGYMAIVGGGYTNTASGIKAIVGGGELNTASGESSVIAGGFTNTSSGEGSTVGGGTTNSSSGICSTIPGGADNIASGLYSTAIGRNANSRVYGQFSHASSSFQSTGDAQFVRFILRTESNSDTAALLYLDGSSSAITLRSSFAYSLNCKIMGVNSDGTKIAEYNRRIIAQNMAGTSSLINEYSITPQYEDDSTTELVISVDNAADTLDLQVRGAVDESWRWVAVVEGIEMCITEA
jgi:hypothetical protein